MNKKHRFPYEWTLKDATFTKDKGTVFSCFACGGGSSMGYKLAGFDVLGCNEIDPKMIEAYKTNHNPKYAYLEPIQTFKLRKDLPKELYNLDILDGSPPCSSFSMAGNREKDWGKEKKFREGQAKQVLDNLFFDFIDLAQELQPKVVVAENVKGLLQGNARKYVYKIYKAFDEAGYYCQHFLLNAAKMGVPQRRERVFFVCLRKDLAKQFLYNKDLVTVVPRLTLEFNEPEILFKEIDSNIETGKIPPSVLKMWDDVKPGASFSTAHEKGSFFNFIKVNPDKAIPTITNGKQAQSSIIHYRFKRALNDIELCNGGSYPNDYDFCKNKPVYLIGMSVPPIVTANIATEIYDQWLKHIK